MASEHPLVTWPTMKHYENYLIQPSQIKDKCMYYMDGPTTMTTADDDGLEAFWGLKA